MAKECVAAEKQGDDTVVDIETKAQNDGLESDTGVPTSSVEILKQETTKPISSPC